MTQQFGKQQENPSFTTELRTLAGTSQCFRTCPAHAIRIIELLHTANLIFSYITLHESIMTNYSNGKYHNCYFTCPSRTFSMSETWETVRLPR
jgi:NAD-dependent dihydropyrimidine dehydrogenase PreA subunit